MINISKAKPEDARGIQEVYFHCFMSTYPNNSYGVTEKDVEVMFGDYLGIEEVKKRTKQIEDLTPKDNFFVAKNEDDAVVGLCRFINKKDFDQLQSIYVLPQYQGQGIGTMLWEQAKKFVNSKVIVHVATYNSNAIAFYKKNGFVDTGKRFTEERHKMPVSGSLIPEMEMIWGEL